MVVSCGGEKVVDRAAFVESDSGLKTETEDVTLQFGVLCVFVFL